MAIKKNYAKKSPVLRSAAGINSAHQSLHQSSKLTESQQMISNFLAYFVPPVCLIGVFFFCKSNTFTPGDNSTAEAIATATKEKPALASAAGSAPAAVEAPKPVQPVDNNNDLPAYSWPAHKANLLTANKVTVSMGATKDKFVAENAINGSIDNNATLAVAPASADAAWWMAEFKDKESPSAVSSIVIYGGGSASPVGKMGGGVQVTVEDITGKSISHKICEDGYAIEGYEVWDLDSPTIIKSVKITPLQPEKDLVLREVQIIGDKF